MNSTNHEVEVQCKTPERKHGVVICTKLSRGFGFILDTERLSVFFHAKNCENGKIPDVGNRVSFILSVDRIGRPVATRVRIEDGGAL
jgi:cold shock CspA family protein